MNEQVTALLAAFGFAVPPDNPLIVFLIANVTEKIKNLTNLSAIPDGLTRASRSPTAIRRRRSGLTSF